MSNNDIDLKIEFIFGKDVADYIKHMKKTKMESFLSLIKSYVFY